MQFRQKIEVHPINACYQGRREENDIDDRKHFNDFILFDAQNADENILKIIETFKIKVGIVDQRLDIF